MFNKEETFILKELVLLEIKEVEDMINSSEPATSDELKAHLLKLQLIDAKL